MLGAMGDLTPPSSSLYWFPQNEEQLPLKAWAEQHSGGSDSSFNGGIAGHGLGFSRLLAGLPALPLEERIEAGKFYWAEDSPQLKLMSEGRGYRNMMNNEMRSDFDKPNAWREISNPNGGGSSSVVEELKAENEALRSELAALKAQGGSKL